MTSGKNILMANENFDQGIDHWKKVPAVTNQVSTRFLIKMSSN